MPNRSGPPAAQRVSGGGWDALYASVDNLLQRRPASSVHVDEHPTARSRGLEVVDRGLLAVPIYKIAPVAPRGQPFEQFLPPQSSTGDPTSNLQPIVVYKVGDSYLVSDGNQRLVQARSRGLLFLRAQVLEVIAEPTMRLSEEKRLLLEYERDTFIDQLELPLNHPVAMLEARTLGSFTHLRAQLAQIVVPLQPDALERWYEQWYLPVARVIRRSRILAKFPRYQELDMYLWAVERHGRLAAYDVNLQRVRLARRSVLALWLATRSR